jgi:hypothetical protein
MTEKNYVVNVKTKNNTIITVRADSAEELNANITEMVNFGVNDSVLALEELFLGIMPTAPSAVDLVSQTLGATVTSITPVGNFAPVPPPVATPSVAGQRMCQHGPMVTRKGSGAKGEWKGYFCPTPKGTEGQCTPEWVTKNMPEWNTI